MAQEIVLFHSALGLRPAVLEFAERLRAAGHRVHTPDSFDGQVFESLENGVRKRDALGIPELMRRANAAVSALPDALVFAGFSMGTGSAEYLAATRPGAKAAVLMHGAIAPAKVAVHAWPRSVLVQVHYAKDDPWVDPNEVSALAAAVKASGGKIDVYTYPHGGHLFADKGLTDYSSESAWVMTERLLEFLARLDFGERPTVETPVAEREVTRSADKEAATPVTPSAPVAAERPADDRDLKGG